MQLRNYLAVTYWHHSDLLVSSVKSQANSPRQSKICSISIFNDAHRRANRYLVLRKSFWEGRSEDHSQRHTSMFVYAQTNSGDTSTFDTMMRCWGKASSNFHNYSKIKTSGQSCHAPDLSIISDIHLLKNCMQSFWLKISPKLQTIPIEWESLLAHTKHCQEALHEPIWSHPRRMSGWAKTGIHAYVLCVWLGPNGERDHYGKSWYPSWYPTRLFLG